MSPEMARLLASMGYNECPAARAEREGTWPAGPTSPVSAKRLRRGRSLKWFADERRRLTPDEQRAAMRADILGNGRLAADPENAWRLDQLEQNRRHHVLRYRLAISAMKALPSLPFPADPPPEMYCARALCPRPALRLVTKETTHV